LARKGPNIKDNDNEYGRNINPPYFKGKRITKILKKDNIKASFSPPSTLWKILVQEKDVIEPSNYKGLYSFPYYCGKKYIDETRISI